MYDLYLDSSIWKEIWQYLPDSHDFPASRLSCLDGLGPVEHFESALKEPAGAQFALALSSGSAALHAALLACDIGPGDEVIVSPYGWGQTVSMVLLTGATPVFADIDPITGNLDPNAAARAISEHTRAILVTHMFGLPAAMDVLEKVCRHYDIYLIADGAQALGARYRDKPVGAWGDITCFSFGRGKIITTGEGGAAVTCNPELYEKMILLSQHPVRSGHELESRLMRQSITEFNMSYRMPALSAAVGLAQLSGLEHKVNRARDIAAQAGHKIKEIGLIPPGDHDGAFHVFHSLVIRDPEPEHDRNKTINLLIKNGIQASTGPIGTPLHHRSPFSGENNGWFPPSLVSKRHTSWHSESCRTAIQRCYREEIIINLSHNQM